MVAATCDAQSKVFTLDASTAHLPIDTKIEYLIESEPLTREQVASDELAALWHPLNQKAFRSIPHPAPIWVRFNAINTSRVTGEWLLEVGWQLLDHVDVSQYNHVHKRWSQRMTAGDLTPLQQRPIKHRHFLFPLELPQGELTSIYVRIASADVIFLTFDVWKDRAFWHHDQQRVFLLGLFFGILAVMSLYNLFLYISIKDKNYLVYVVYVATIILYALATTGVGSTYVWSESLWLKKRAYWLFASSGYLMAALFIRYFLSLKTYGGWLLHLNNFFLACWLLVTAACLLPATELLLAGMQPIAVLSLAAGMTTSIYLWVKGNIQAKYYTIAYVFLYVGTAILIMGLTGILPRSPLTEYSQRAGFVLELVLLSLALADRINRESASREDAQLVALDLSRKISKAREEKLIVQEQVLELQRRTNEDLELRVLERTNELERAMKNLEMANKELSNLSFTDPLTKVYNRRYFDQILEEEIKRASRNRQPVTVAIVDIDHFKQVNDTHGHLIGDECLRLVAATLQQQLGRTGDLLARFGGEEFAIILPATTQENAMVAADRARKAVENLDFIHRSQRIHLNVSIGMAGWIPEIGETTEALIQAADSALYIAKRSGRNQVVTAR